ncbi:MAG: SDR family oxidoreductase [Candidatus Korobacteraceae bacterium]|jgi:NAD(P)-dependent dehydrogenase (short-subunit alcohol dehydrogenase family)
MAAKNPQSHRKTGISAQESRSGNPRLLGKVAVVTGGSRGIGFAIARTFAAEGCSVVITGRDAATLAKSAAELRRLLPKKSHAHNDNAAQIVTEVCDVRDPDSVASLFAMVKQRLSRLDVLVNNAGIAQPAVSIEQTSLEVWRAAIDTNLTGLFLCTRAALPVMQSGATIINNLSVAAKTVFPNFAAYNASKHGALGFTLSLRDELIPRGIRVVALMPGATDTDLWQQFWPDAPRERMMDVESVAEAVLYAVLLPPNANLSELVLAPSGGAL